VYDRIGGQYRRGRQEDPRIAAPLWAALKDASPVLNVGAGSGSYEPRDRVVVAAEPSAVMLSQRLPGSAPAVRAVAEVLPFRSGALGAAMGVLTLHHWRDRARGLAEMRRVSRGRVVLFVRDPQVVRSWWLYHYFPGTARLEASRETPLGQVAQLLGGRLSRTDVERGETLTLLARTAGELGHSDLFDQAIRDAALLLDQSDTYSMLFNPFSFREVHLRGLLATGRPDRAAALASVAATGHAPTAPQWAIIERITAADVLANAGEPEQAASALMEATIGAEERRLPHQLQRIIRVTAQSKSNPIHVVQQVANEALDRLRALLDRGSADEAHQQVPT
jgi:SAM-dependent methyltransferase